MDTLTCDVESESAAMVVTVVGKLSVATAPSLRRTLVKCLADCPPALIVDLAGLAVAHDSALQVFGVVLLNAERWPTVPMLLCAPRPLVRAAIARVGLTRRVPVCASRDEAALRAVDAALPNLRRELPPVRSSCGEARELVRAACLRWQLTGLVESAELVVTELVSNAVLHARTSLTVVLSVSSRHLHVVVRDGSRQPPIMSHAERYERPEDIALHGRGLQLIDAAAASWGVMLTHDGKAVWARIRRPDRP